MPTLRQGYVESQYSPVGRGFSSFFGNSWGALDHWDHTIPPYWGPEMWEGALDWHADQEVATGGGHDRLLTIFLAGLRF